MRLVTCTARPRAGDYRHCDIEVEHLGVTVRKVVHWGGVVEAVAIKGRPVELVYRVARLLREAEREAAHQVHGPEWRQYVTPDFWGPPTPEGAELAVDVAAKVAEAFGIAFDFTRPALVDDGDVGVD